MPLQKMRSVLRSRPFYKQTVEADNDRLSADCVNGGPGATTISTGSRKRKEVKRIHLITPARTGQVAMLGLVALPFVALTGCAGAGFGDFNRNTNGDIGNGFNSSLGATSRSRQEGVVTGNGRGTYAMIATSFQLTNLPGDPFDFERVNVQVTLRRPDNSTIEVPAFYDGDTTWRMRYTPTQSGSFSVVNVKLNGQIAHEEKLEKKDWNVNGQPDPGFVRIDRGDHSRFVFDNGQRYYPLGHNQAWHSDKLPDIPELFGKMHDAGENWSRVWMNHWDNKNLDWNIGKQVSHSTVAMPDPTPSLPPKTDSAAPARPGSATPELQTPQRGTENSKAVTKESTGTKSPLKLGEIDLEVARRWDDIVAAAQKQGIYFQMVLQHHGQYSTKVNPNWDDNPYNVKKGGFLNRPEEFFTNPQARALTKRKLYYMIARWGYSPSILAWELFNEVQFTDAGRNKQNEQIALWHKEMALFLRQFDENRHLITTSSAPDVPHDSPIWETVDYVQTHIYPTDVITALGASVASSTKKGADRTNGKPSFVGEFGPSNLHDPEGVFLHAGLWASLMSNPSGGAQYWEWDSIEKNDLYSPIRAATTFVAASGLSNHGALVPTTFSVDTPRLATLRFGPGGSWDKATQDEFVVGKEGAPQGMAAYPVYMQGEGHRDMMPKPLVLHVNFAQPGTFAVVVDKIAKNGALLKVTVDGKSVEREYPAGKDDYVPKEDQQSVQVSVPQGSHDIAIQNTGKDWLMVRQFALTNYTSALAAMGRVGKDYAVAWVYHRGNIYEPLSKESGLESATGKLRLTGLQPGNYRYTWFDSVHGKSLDAGDLTVSKETTKETNGKTPDGATIDTPPVKYDVALCVTKAGPAPRLKGQKPVSRQVTSK